jgi:hypothetical protein
VFYLIISNGAILLCFIPLLFLGWRNIRQIRAWWILAAYWLLNGFDNLLGVWFSSGTGAHHTDFRELSFYLNLIEPPLALLIFASAHQGRARKGALLTLILFATGESVLVRLHGRNDTALILGAGAAIIIGYSAMGLWEYLKKMEHTRFENSMVFVYASLLFSYGSMLIIYIFAHYHHAAASNDFDSFLLYYISLLLSAAITCAGLWTYGIGKRRRQPWSAPSRYSSSSS